MKTRIHFLQLLLFFCSTLIIAQTKDDDKLKIRPYAGLNFAQTDFNNFADNGFSFGLSLDQYLSERFALGIDFSQQSNTYKNNFNVSQIPASIEVMSENQKNWGIFSVTAGPTYKIGAGNFDLEVYGKGGISFVKSPSARISLNNTPVFNIEEENYSSFGLTTGLRFNYKLSNRISVFANPQLSWSASRIKYSERNFIIIPGNEENPDTQIDFEQDFTEETIIPSVISINAGISINLGGNPRDESINVDPPMCSSTISRIKCNFKSTFQDIYVTTNYANLPAGSIINYALYDSNTSQILLHGAGQNLPSTISGSGVFNTMINYFGNFTGPIYVRHIITDASGAVICQDDIDGVLYGCALRSCNIADVYASCNNGIPTLDFSVPWSNYNSFTGLFVIPELSDANGPITSVAIAPVPLTSANGTANFSITLPSQYAGTQLTINTRICKIAQTKGCCQSKYVIDIPECCDDCIGTQIKDTTKPNQVGNNFLVSGQIQSNTNNIKKVTAQLRYVVTDDLNASITIPVNFELQSNSTINNSVVNTIASISGYRSTLVSQDLPPNTTTTDVKLYIDNYMSKQMVDYHISLMVFFDNGKYCELFLTK